MVEFLIFVVLREQICFSIFFLFFAPDQIWLHTYFIFFLFAQLLNNLCIEGFPCNFFALND